MNQCACGGFIPSQSSVCPNCKKTNFLKRAMVIAGGAFASMTLAACYGVPCASTSNGRCVNPCDEVQEDGGNPENNPASYCYVPPQDAGHDGGTDAGVDGGP